MVVRGPGTVYRFGSFRFDPGEFKLWDSDQPIPLTPKVIQILEFLIVNRQRIVTKRELLEKVWPDCVVEESNITQNVSVLRKALREGDTERKFIATFPRRGYRFVGEVTEETTLTPDAVTGYPLGSEEKTEPHLPSRQTWPRRWSTFAGLFFLVSAALGAIFWYRTPSSLSLEPGVAVTHLPGREFQPAISPDGNRVAFVYHAEAESTLRIGIVDIRQHAGPEMLSPPGQDAFSPAWSPDGGSVAYLRYHGGSLMAVVQQSGAQPVQVAQLAGHRGALIERQLDWSPDGRFLAVSNKPSIEEPYRIELIHISERSSTPVTTPHPLADGDFEPRFSPDGKKLAFLRVASRARMDIYVVNLPAGVPYQVTAAEQPIGGLDWTPDATSLAFSAARGGVSRVWVVPDRNSISPWAPTSFISPSPVQLSISRTTGRMVTASPQPDENIWRTRLSPEGVSSGWEPWITSNRNDWFPSFSPDSTQVAFLSDRSGEHEVWIKGADGAERQVTSGNLLPNYASWTADGKHLFFPGLRHRRIYRVAIGSSSPRIVQVDGDTGAHAVVSPDGSDVLVTRRYYIFQAPAGGGQRKTLTDQGGYPLRLSPDGEWVYYTRHRFSNEIWRLRRFDGRTEQVSDRLQSGCWACWAVNGGWLVYVAAGERQAPASIERLELATGNRYVMGALPRRLPPLGRGALALSPDGASLLAVVGEAGSGDVLLSSRTPWAEQ